METTTITAPMTHGGVTHRWTRSTGKFYYPVCGTRQRTGRGSSQLGLPFKAEIDQHEVTCAKCLKEVK